MNVLIVGGPIDWVKGAFQEKLDEVGLKMVAHWPARKRPPNTFPKDAKAAILLIDFLGHSLRHKVKTLIPEGIPAVEVPFRRWSLAKTVLAQANLVVETVRAETPSTSENPQISRTLIKSLIQEQSREKGVIEVFVGETIPQPLWDELLNEVETEMATSKMNQWLRELWQENPLGFPQLSTRSEFMDDLKTLCESDLDESQVLEVILGDNALLKNLQELTVKAWAFQMKEEKGHFPTWRGAKEYLESVFHTRRYIGDTVAKIVKSTPAWQAETAARKYPKEEKLERKRKTTDFKSEEAITKPLMEIGKLIREFSSRSALDFYIAKLEQMGVKLTREAMEKLKAEAEEFFKKM